MKNTSMLFLLCCMCFFGATAQEIKRCGFDQSRVLRLASDTAAQRAEYKENLRLLDYQRRYFPPPPPSEPGGPEGIAGINPTSKYVIPVVFHIVHRTSETTPTSASGYLNIKDEQVWSQLDKMNAAFAAYNIQFCLAERNVNGTALSKPGIIRTANNALINHIADSSDQLALKAADMLLFPAQKYLNVWIVGTINEYPTGGALAGYYGHPNRRSDLEGIVMAAECLGNNAYYGGGFSLNPDYNLGNTMVHELGHYFGLYHTFEGACSSIGAPDQSVVGDWCYDTPPMAEITTCATSSNSCSEAYFSTAPFNRFDLLDNFMGYTEENCFTAFTDSQTVRMWANLEVKRKTLWSNRNIIDSRISCLFRSCFYTSGSITCIGDSVIFNTFDLPNLSYTWNFGTGSPVTTTSKSIKFAYPTPGTYNVYLTVTDLTTSNSITNTDPVVIQVTNCTPLSDPQANWFFGNLGGVTFTSSGPRPNYGAYNNNTMSTSEGGVSISDNNGSLLFYAGGTFSVDTFGIWNRNHQLMKGVDSIYGGSSQQQNMILKDPKDSNRYFLFVVPDQENIVFPGMANGLYYHIIDMRGDGGLGEVVSKNNPVMDTVNFIPIPSNGDGAIRTTEAITAVPFCGDDGYWIIVGGHFSDSVSTFGKKLFIYKLDTAGLAFHGFYDRSTVIYATTQFKASPNGNYIAHFSHRPGVGTLDTYVEIHSFDKTNGTFVKTRKVPFNNWVGLSFSPNSEVLYMSGYDYPNYMVYQMNLKAADLSGAIVPTKSRYNFTEPTCFQLGPDQKLYVGYANYSDEYLHVFDTPDSVITVDAPNACGFREYAVNFNPDGSYPFMSPIYNLPNMMDAKSIRDLPQAIQHQYVSCDSVNFEIPVCGPASWDFGDPASGGLNTSTDRYTGHTFSGFGTYTVTYTGDGGTLTKNITIGIDSPTVSGNRIICDTAFLYTYSSAPNLNYYYEWYVNGVSVKQGVDNTVKVKWEDPGGTIQVKVTDMVKGCSLFSREDSVILRPANNNIYLEYPDGRDTVFADVSPSPNTIYGDTPTTGVYDYTIKWQINRSGIDTQWIDLLPADTLLNYSPGAIDSFVMYRRVVTLGGTCPNFSAPVIFYRNGIDKYSCPFDKVQQIYGVNNAPFLQGTYTWEFSRDSLNWEDLDGFYSKDLSIEIPQDSTWFFRRRVELISGQVHYSNEIRHHQYRIAITSPLRDTVVCRENLQPFDLTVTTNVENSFVARWEIKAGNDTIWRLNNMGPELVYTPGNNANIDSIRVTVYSICTPYQPDTKVFRVLKHKQPSIDLYPGTSTIFANDTNVVKLFAIVRDSIFYLITDSSLVSSQIQWERKLNNGSWETMVDSTKDSIMVIMNVCENNTSYRAWVYNGCYVTYSDPVVLTIDSIADLYIRDSTSDSGSEPNGGIVGSWSSPDIWNRRANDGIRAHQHPLFTTYTENLSSALPNYIYVQVRNRGDYPSPLQELNLYWSRFGSGQKWERSWADTPNNRTFSPLLGYDIPLGNKVNTTPILIPRIEPGDSVTIAYEWYPPNPIWYGGYNFGGSPTGGFSPLEHPLCYLARVTPCTDAPFGMKVNETTNTLNNVKNNNNIAARNESFRRIGHLEDGGTPCCTGPGPKTLWTFIQNQRMQDTIINIRVETDAAFTFSNYGKVYLYMDDAFYSLFQNAGYQITGATATAHAQIYRMTSPVVTISGLAFGDTTRANLGMDFIPDTILPMTIRDRFSIMQWSEDEGIMEGGATIQLDPILPPPILGKRFLSVEEKETAQPILHLYPNPNTGAVHLAIVLPELSNFSVRLMNSLGQEISSSNYGSLPTGTHNFQLDMNNLASGIYYVEMRSGDTVKMEKVVLQK